MADSPRWCDNCQAWGDHHTDRCPDKAAADDPFRFCVYCNADCYEDETQHVADCPSSTGVYPVRAEDLMPCPNCGYHLHGMRCMDCEADLNVGDHYMHREVDPGDPLLPGVEGAAIFEVICVGCAAEESLA